MPSPQCPAFPEISSVWKVSLTTHVEVHIVLKANLNHMSPCSLRRTEEEEEKMEKEIGWTRLKVVAFLRVSCVLSNAYTAAHLESPRQHQVEPAGARGTENVSLHLSTAVPVIRPAD